jgi:hypothetical protein
VAGYAVVAGILALGREERMNAGFLGAARDFRAGGVAAFEQRSDNFLGVPG